MARILVGGAGAAASNGFIRSLRASGRGHIVVGANASPADLLLADVDERYVVPSVRDAAYEDALGRLLDRCRPDLLHVQSDPEVRRVSELRDSIVERGVRLLLPAHEDVLVCQDKWRSYERWRDAGLRVPETRLLERPPDLADAFGEIGDELWLRESSGAGGAGSLRTSSLILARAWIESRGGWGRFTAAECLTERTVTWQSLWYEGQLVVAQGRRRHGWAYGRNVPTGVSGITGMAETCSDPVVNDVALCAIAAVSEAPHGIWGVDMTEDGSGIPNPTEINIGRFFTTHEFFTRAGLNLPQIYVDLALEAVVPSIPRPLNPLPDGLLWIRGMDVEPVLTSVAELERLDTELRLA